MSAPTNDFVCSECQRLTSKTSEIQAQIMEARAELERAIEAADGTSARKYNLLEELLKAETRIIDEMSSHNQLGHSAYVCPNPLTHNAIET